MGVTVAFLLSPPASPPLKAKVRAQGEGRGRLTLFACVKPAAAAAAAFPCPPPEGRDSSGEGQAGPIQPPVGEGALWCLPTGLVRQNSSVQKEAGGGRECPGGCSPGEAGAEEVKLPRGGQAGTILRRAKGSLWACYIKNDPGTVPRTRNPALPLSLLLGWLCGEGGSWGSPKCQGPHGHLEQRGQGGEGEGKKGIALHKGFPTPTQNMALPPCGSTAKPTNLLAPPGFR